MYNNLLDSSIVVMNKNIWKIKMQMKIKIFMWYLCLGVTFTKDGLVKCNWKNNVNCSFF
jgi:NhaP-type Na+/H+ and K+/H+ antiporter